MVITALLFWLTASGTAFANSEKTCLHAARLAAKEQSVPVNVMAAMTLAETGRRRAGTFAPWPWTINANGVGEWFATKAEAVARVRELQASGVRSIDVGCFQVNLRWHGDAFKSLNHAFDPVMNARYAAGFLRDLKADSNTWLEAAGHYHSRNAKPAARYRARLAAFLEEKRQSPIRPNTTATAMEASLSRSWILELGSRTSLIGTVSIRPLLSAKNSP